MITTRDLVPSFANLRSSCPSVSLILAVEDDPGREMVDLPVLGHRFFFSPEEVEPLEAET